MRKTMVKGFIIMMMKKRIMLAKKMILMVRMKMKMLTCGFTPILTLIFSKFIDECVGFESAQIVKMLASGSHDSFASILD